MKFYKIKTTMRGARNTNSNSKKESSVDTQRRSEAIKYARQLRASGLYAWADQWDKWSRGPIDAPQPPNYHSESKRFNGEVDPRLKMYPETLASEMGDAAYYRWLNRTRNPSTTGFRAGGGCGTVARTKGDEPRFPEELTNAELGLVRDKNGHPSQLIKKLQDLKRKYPDTYAKNDLVI